MQIRIENLTHVYLAATPQETTALKDVSISIEKGKIIGIIGKTGSGKSTLIQTLNRLIKPTIGKVWVDEVEVTGKKTDLALIRQKVGLIFQYPEHQLFEDTVYNDIAFGPRNLNLPEEEVDVRVKEAMVQVGLEGEEIATNSPLALSGGQKRRVAIAGVLAMRPEVLILDEPTAALDPRGRRSLLKLLQDLKEKKQITVIMVSHSMDEVAKIADHLIVLHDGQVVLKGSPREIFSNRDKLLEIGLAVPQLTELMARLNARGVKVASDVITLEEAVREICRNREDVADV